MLKRLRVKNLALIEEEEIFFSDGLNILTGETGAGKSVLMGSLSLALGSKADPAMIRQGASEALVELEFELDDEKQRAFLSEMDLEPDEDTVLIRRKIHEGKSSAFVCGESVTARQLKQIGERFVTVYGQRDHDRLLNATEQLAMLDGFAGRNGKEALARVSEAYGEYRKLLAGLSEKEMDEETRRREEDLCRYEIAELESADLKDGEDIELEKRFRRLQQFSRLTQAASEADRLLSPESGAQGLIGEAVRALSGLSGIDEKVDEIYEQIVTIDGLMGDVNRALYDYSEDLSFDPQEYAEIENRLDLINRLQEKYLRGKTIQGSTASVLRGVLEDRRAKLQEIEDYTETRQLKEQECARAQKQMKEAALELSGIRKTAAKEIETRMEQALSELNFRKVRFEARIESDPDNCTAKGIDDVCFCISLNEGEAVRPLEQVASGGELSRIMLAAKTLFADQEDIHTFLFDEIDSGISGETAWRVAQKMAELSGNHQLLCITHLPQIAAMYDSHYEIYKEMRAGRTLTKIRPLSEEESTEELSRLLGGGESGPAARNNACELRHKAVLYKQGRTIEDRAE